METYQDNSLKTTAESGKGKWWMYETYAIITSVWTIRDTATYPSANVTGYTVIRSRLKHQIR